MRRWIGVIGALFFMSAFVVAAAPASASSIFFLRDNNIWVANPDGTGAKAVTTDGTAAEPYNFVSSAKEGTAPLLAFERGGDGGAIQYGTISPTGTDETVNADNSNMLASDWFFTRIDAAGNRVTWADHSGNGDEQTWDPASVSTAGTGAAEITGPDLMDARFVTFGDASGTSLLFTDYGDNYGFSGNPVCGIGFASVDDVLVLQTPPATQGQNVTALYCADSTSLSMPALSPNGALIAAQASDGTDDASGHIVTIPIGGGVTSSSDQSPLTQITAANSDDSLPDFSPDSTEIAFQGPNDTIDTVPAGGGTPTQILTDATVPAWSSYSLPGSTPPPPPPTQTKLKLELTGRSSQNLVKQKQLIVYGECNLRCTLSVTAELKVKGAKKPYKLAPGSGTIRANYSAEISITMSRKVRSTIEKALKHHKHVTGLVTVTAKTSGQTVTLKKTIRVRN